MVMSIGIWLMVTLIVYMFFNRYLVYGQWLCMSISRVYGYFNWYMVNGWFNGLWLMLIDIWLMLMLRVHGCFDLLMVYGYMVHCYFSRLWLC